MKRHDIKLNFNRMMGPGSVTPAMINSFKTRIRSAHGALKQKREDGELGFMYLPYDMKSRDDIKLAAEAAAQKFETVVAVCADGAAAGLRTLASALLHPHHNLLSQDKRKGTRLFIADSADPEACSALLGMTDIKKTIVNIVTKSGNTPATAAYLKVFWNMIEKKLGKGRLKDHLVITTGNEKSLLKEMAARHGLVTFSIPENGGGSFSVFSAAGMFPLAAAGADIDELLKGAARMDTLSSNDNPWKNPAYMSAALRYISDTGRKRRISVLMPYPTALSGLGEWFVMLWAGALGKRAQAGAGPGLMPVNASGAQGQYSRVQLYTGGPDNKVITFVTAGKFREDETIPAGPGEYQAVSYLNGKKMSVLLNTGAKAAERALAGAGKPSMTLSLPEISAYTLGQLMYFFQVEAAFLAELYSVSTFDRPGAELVKEAAAALMGKKAALGALKGLPAQKDKGKYII